MDLSKIGPGKSEEIVNVVIEIPRGSGNKYEFDKGYNAVVLDRVQPTSMKQPYDYGFVPRTLCEDGDPLDALVVIDEPLYPGVVLSGRVLGVLYMIDGGDKDEKLVCVAEEDMGYEYVRSLEDLGDHFKAKVAHYFERYKDLQNKEVTIDGWGGIEEAKKVVRESIERYEA